MSDVPKFHEFFRPVLVTLQNGQQEHWRDVAESCANQLDLSPELRAEMVKVGRKRYEDRTHWALAYLVQAGALVRPKRAHVAITDRGRELLEAHPGAITVNDLKQYPEFVEFTQRIGTKGKNKSVEPASAVDDATSDMTPTDLMETAYAEHNASLGAELIERLRQQDPAFLERALLKLMVAMGYGGSDEDTEHLGGTGDQGVDGVINRDRLGLDRLYIQAKRYKADNVVRSGEVQQFVGALQKKGASGGIFITTSRFTDDALDFAEGISPRVVMIDGDRLGELMITHGIGIQAKDTYVVNEVDEDFFE